MARRLIPLVAVVAVVLSAAPTAGAGTSTTTIEGEVQRLVVELRGGGGVDLTIVVPDDGDVVRVRTEDLADVPTGSVVAVEVTDVQDTSQDVLDVEGGAEVVDVDVLEAPESADQAARLAEAGLAASISGVRSVAVVVGWIDGQTPDPVTTAQVAAEVTDFVAPYWSDSTDGALTFAVGGQTSAGEYSGWGTSGCSANQIYGILDWSATQAGVYPTVGEQRHSVLYTPWNAACGFAGVSYVADGGSAWINGTDGARWITIAHELGHTVTLGHSNSRVFCDSNGTSVPDGTSAQCWDGEYGDAYDVMGTSVSGGPGPLNGAHLDALGLLPAGSVTATSSQAVTLAPVGGLTGTRFVKFASNGFTYFVEYRGAVGRDTDLDTARVGCPYGVFDCAADQQGRYTPGVVVHRVDQAGVGSDTYLLDAMAGDPAWETLPWFVVPAGMTFTTADGVVSVSVTMVSGAGAALVLTMPERPFAQIVLSRDFTGDARADVFTVDASGHMYLFPGLGNGYLDRMRTLAEGWDEMKVYAPGDWNGGGASDLMATDLAGALWLYPGDGTGGLLPRVQVGFGWFGFRIVPAGDVNGDGRPDLLAMDSAGRLWLYPGAGGGLFGRRIQVGNGWNGFELFAAGDQNGDHRADILSIDTSGKLWFYAGTGGGYFARRVQVGQGWHGFVFASGADLNNDGLNDLLGRDSSGRLWYYAGRLGGRFAVAVQVAAGW